MIPFPNPLHPAVVHFPIALLLLGSVAAILAVFLRRWHLPVFAAVLLVFGAAGAAVATATGDEAAERVGDISEAGEKGLEHHEDWGEMTRNIAIAAALLSVVAALTANKRTVGVAFSILTALCALAAAYAVAQTGHYGGELVYRHGAGVKIARPAEATEKSSPAGQKSKEDDD